MYKVYLMLNAILNLKNIFKKILILLIRKLYQEHRILENG